MRLVANRHQLHELEQEGMTYKGPRATSRLDRVYTNQHVAGQLDSKVGCVALGWPRGASDHRPIAFYRRTTSGEEGLRKYWGNEIFNDREWAREAALNFFRMLEKDNIMDQNVSGLRELAIIKKAMNIASETVKGRRAGRAEVKAESEEDLMGRMIKFVKAVEKRATR